MKFYLLRRSICPAHLAALIAPPKISIYRPNRFGGFFRADILNLTPAINAKSTVFPYIFLAMRTIH